MPMWNPWRGCRRCSEGCVHCYIHKGDAKRGVDTSEIVQTKDFYKPVEQLKKGGYKMKPRGWCIWAFRPISCVLFAFIRKNNLQSGTGFADRPSLPVGSFTMCRWRFWRREICGTAPPSIIRLRKRPAALRACFASAFWKR